MVQVHVSAMTWRFDSSYPHHLRFGWPVAPGPRIHKVLAREPVAKAGLFGGIQFDRIVWIGRTVLGIRA